MFKKKSIVLILSFCLMILFTACAKDISQEEMEDETPNVDVDKDIAEEIEATEEEEIEEVEEVDPKEKIDLSLEPNEMGQAMVLMYHNIGEEEEEWTRTPENFKKDLKTLYDSGYRAVSLEDYVNNTMNVESGKTPVVITFDDGNENNFRIIQDENGEDLIDPNSAIGILEQFKAEYPDFNTTATFFVFGTNAFRQAELLEYKFNYLIDNGYDIGNHTLDHRSMKKADGKEYIQEGIGKQVEIIKDVLPQYEVNTYALCYGERPKSDELSAFLEKGTYKDREYENIAILNVGWNPVNSPVSTEFNPLSIPRIRASEMKVDNVGMYDWMDYLDNNPDKRYISDGVEEVITVPKALEDEINKDKLGEKELFIYEKDEN